MLLGYNKGMWISKAVLFLYLILMYIPDMLQLHMVLMPPLTYVLLKLFLNVVVTPWHKQPGSAGTWYNHMVDHTQGAHMWPAPNITVIALNLFSAGLMLSVHANQYANEAKLPSGASTDWPSTACHYVSLLLVNPQSWINKPGTQGCCEGRPLAATCVSPAVSLRATHTGIRIYSLTFKATHTGFSLSSIVIIPVKK